MNYYANSEVRCTVMSTCLFLFSIQPLVLTRIMTVLHFILRWIPKLGFRCMSYLVFGEMAITA